jgi:hypothetical protein
LNVGVVEEMVAMVGDLPVVDRMDPEAEEELTPP